MQLTFPCPNCGNEYDLPWSMAGKKARCKRCSHEFLVPAPFEAKPPKSSEAIPVAQILEPPPKAFVPKTVRMPVPTPAPAPVEGPGVGRPDPAPRMSRGGQAVTPELLERLRNGSVARPGELDSVMTRGALAPKSKPEKPPKPAGRPPWLIPALAGGGVTLLVALNVGLYFAFAGGKADPADPGKPGLHELAGSEPAATSPEASGFEAPPAEVVAPATPPSKPPSIPKKATTPAKVAEEIPDRPMTTSEIVARFEPSVALIKGKKGSGTGFIARAGIVATNAHVIDGERIKDIEVRFPSAEESKQGPYPARRLYEDKGRDLVLLGVETDLPPVPVARGYKFRKGEDVTVIGNPGVGGRMILENAISRGIVSSMTTLNDHSFLQLGISINPGNSGGPVFDPKGRVIGVVTLKTTKQEGLAFAIPADDLQDALGTAESMVANDPADGPGSPGGTPPLAYTFKLGQTYVYSLDLNIDAGNVRLSLNGNSVYRVKAVDAEGITFGHKGWLTTTRKGKDGKVLPGGVSGPGQSNEIELKIDDKGNVLKASGSSPLPLLGDLAMLMIEPLPDDARRTWDDSQTLVLREVEQAPGVGGGMGLGRPGLDSMPQGPRSRLSPRSRPNSRIGRPPAPAPSQPQVKVTLHEAKEETTYTLGALDGEKAPIRKAYELTTTEMVGNDPRLKMTGDGTLTFDLKAGIPLALNYKLMVVEQAGNATVKIPISVTCKLLEGSDREKGLRAPVQAPTAMNKVDNGDVTRLLADLKSPDNGKRREALRALFDASPMDGRRGEVARALDRLAADKDGGVRSDAIKAMGVWGDGKSFANLVTTLSDQACGARDELFDAIGRLSPTEKGAEALIPWLSTDQGRASKALRAIGPPAEAPLLRVVEEGADLKLRQESCRLLKDLGTSQSVPALGKLVASKQDGEIGRQAEEACKEIAKRWPGDAEWLGLLKQGRSPDGFKRREAAERFDKIRPVEARRGEVARLLETLVGDVDGRAQAMAIRALGRWGDAGSRSTLIDLLGEPDFRPVREAIEALGLLGPDEASARAIAGRIKFDRNLVIQALSRMGPVAEPAAIRALKGVGNDGFARNDLCKLLGRIGGEDSLPALREAAKGPFPGDPQAALKDVEARIRGQGVAAWISDLKSTNTSKRADALRKIAATTPDPKLGDRAELARTLDGLWDADDTFMKKALGEAVVAWGDEKSAAALVDFLANPDARQWEEAIVALVKLRPDARTAELLAGRFTKDPRRVNELAREFPELAEKPILAIVQGGGDPRWRSEACRALGQFGTPASLRALQALAGRAGDDQMAREAEEALKGIASRQ